MYGSAQLPSKMIAAFSLPSASPHQPTPSWSGVRPNPDVASWTYALMPFFDAAVFSSDFVPAGLRYRPPAWKMNGIIRAQSAARQIGAPLGTAPLIWSAFAALTSWPQFVGALMP